MSVNIQVFDKKNWQRYTSNTLYLVKESFSRCYRSLTRNYWLCPWNDTSFQNQRRDLKHNCYQIDIANEYGIILLIRLKCKYKHTNSSHNLVKNAQVASRFSWWTSLFHCVEATKVYVYPKLGSQPMETRTDIVCINHPLQYAEV